MKAGLDWGIGVWNKAIQRGIIHWSHSSSFGANAHGRNLCGHPVCTLFLHMTKLKSNVNLNMYFIITFELYLITMKEFTLFTF